MLPQNLPEFTTTDGKVFAGDSVKILSAADAVDILFERALLATPDVSIEEAQKTYEFVREGWASQALYRGTPSEMRHHIFSNLQRMQAQDGFEYFRIDVNVDKNHLRAMARAFFANSFQPVGVYRSGDMILACGNASFSGPPQLPIPT